MRVHSAQDLAQSARFDEDNARLMLAGAIAQAYVELYRENALADIAQRSEAQRQNIVDITRRRVSRRPRYAARDCAKPRASCRRHASRASRRGPPRISRSTSSPH